MLLSEFVPYTKSMDVDFLSKSWQSHVSSVDLAQGGVCGRRGYCFVGGGKKCVECARVEPGMVCTCVYIAQYIAHFVLTCFLRE